MIDEYLNYIQEETFETEPAEKSKTVKNSTRIRKKGNRHEVNIDADLGSIEASVGTKDLDEALIGDEDDVEYRLDVSAGIIMKIDENNRQQVLLIQRAEDDHWPNVWEFPRGKCDKPIGESLFHCASREIKEETGLDIIPVSRIDTYEYLADHGKRKTTCHVFLCKMKDPNQRIKLSKEHQDYQWVGEVGEVEMMLMPDQKKVLQKFLNRDRSIVSYPDDGKMQQVEEYLVYLDESKWKRLLAAGKLTKDNILKIQKFKGGADPLYVKQLLKQGKRHQADAYLKKKGIVKPSKVWLAGVERGTQNILKRYKVKVKNKFFGAPIDTLDAKVVTKRFTNKPVVYAASTKGVPRKTKAHRTLIKRHEADEVRTGKRLAGKHYGDLRYKTDLRSTATTSHWSDEVLRKERELVRTASALYGRKGGGPQMEKLRKMTGEYKSLIKSRKQIAKYDKKKLKELENEIRSYKVSILTLIKSYIPILNKRLPDKQRRATMSRKLHKMGLPTLRQAGI